MAEDGKVSGTREASRLAHHLDQGSTEVSDFVSCATAVGPESRDQVVAAQHA